MVHTNASMNPDTRQTLQRGLVIPACPLALNASRKLDERRQRALLRYYAGAGAGGVAIGVHTTQFAIRDPKHGLFEPLLQLAAEELTTPERTTPDRATPITNRPNARSAVARSGSSVQIPLTAAEPRAPLARIGGICGGTSQATREAALLRSLGFHAGLLSLSALKDASDDQLIAHCRAVAEIIPVFGFYLQPAVGGRVLPFSFWRRFVEIENVVAIKIAPFDRYQTLEVLRAVAESRRTDLALYTGNDDTIVLDLLTPYRFHVSGHQVELRIVGGLLGHWAVWTQKAVELLEECHRALANQGPIPADLLRRAIEVTDCNAAFFDASNNFAGCIPGLHEVLRRQGLFEGTWCLDPREILSPGQIEEIDRVYTAYSHLNDDAFVAAHRDEWLRG
jgi:dihydrodipicolinate synthase/N-acetylneuraminate lyase